jgi:hypothetical protein
MNFNIISKKNLGAAGALFLAILLTQSRIFNFLVDTVLGRFALVIMLILISYANNILGVIMVFLIVILFNISDFNYLEGFEGTTNTDNERMNDKKNNNDMNKNMNNKEDENDRNLKKKVYVTTNAKQTKSKNESTDMNEEDNSEINATEGFNILGMENDIKRGKNSNSIPVSNMMNSSDNALPFDPESTKENFSAF